MIKQAARLDISPDLAYLVIDLLLGQPGFFNYFLVENQRAVIGQRAKAAFRAKGEGYFTRNNEVEVSANRQSDGHCHGDTAVGYTEDDGIFTSIFGEFFSEPAPGVIAVFKNRLDSGMAHRMNSSERP